MVKMSYICTVFDFGNFTLIVKNESFASLAGHLSFSFIGRILLDIRRTSDALLISRYQMPSDIRLIDLHYKI